jgi:endo-1,3(4)-beta-glucanase
MTTYVSVEENYSYVTAYPQHFHYGYFVYAAAAVARNDTEWLKGSADGATSTRLDFFLSLVRDVANPSAADPYFPSWRYFDWYEGHSWAAGLFCFGDAKNQESTSE